MRLSCPSLGVGDKRILPMEDRGVLCKLKGLGSAILSNLRASVSLPKSYLWASPPSDGGAALR